jgi:hypothetical protein
MAHKKQLALPKIDSADGLLAFLHDELDWPIPDNAVADELTFDWSGSELRLAEQYAQRLHSGSVRQLRPLVQGQQWGIFLLEFADPHIYRTALRQILRGLIPSRRRLSTLQAWHHENLLFICATADYTRISFAHFRGDDVHRAKLSTFGWSQDSLYARTLVEHNLPNLQWPDDPSDGSAWQAQWAKAFDKEPLTKEFFKRFDRVLDGLKSDLEKFDRLEPAQAYSRAQLLLERLIFLYFLQNRGWLDQQRDYLIANFKQHRANIDKFTYYAEFLERLFFTLSTPADFQGPGAKLRYDGIPFLNGGLFDDDEFAQTEERKKGNPPLHIRNGTFGRVFDELLEAFNFTVREDTPLNQDVAVDPEMLGKVFESIILHAEAADPDATAPDKRKETGSYYTPRIVVHFICRESLYQYLVPHLPADRNWEWRLRTLIEMDASDWLGQDEIEKLRDLLKPDEGKVILELISQLKCCDPAVGSGAFPVGLLQELLNLNRLARTAANGYVDPARMLGNQWVHDTKAHIVENCLYGVDIQQQAIEICRLRLWLSLVVDYDIGCDPLIADRDQYVEAIRRISQLPNLESNFKRGDSLLDMIAGVPVRIDSAVTGRHREHIEAIQRLGHDLHKAKTAKKKRETRINILGHRFDLTQSVLSEEKQRLLRDDANLATNWFGQTTSEAEKQRRTRSEISRLDDARAKLAKDQKELKKIAPAQGGADFYPRLRKLEGADFDSPFNFVWQIDFAEIFHPRPVTTTLAGGLNLGDELAAPTRKGGFDIMVGNPPFVTARNETRRELYRERWPRVCYKNYLLICPFFALGFEYLRPNGTLSYIVSNAFAKREFGRPLIELFFPTIDLTKVIDCSGLLFPGHGTPTCIIFASNHLPDPNCPVRIAATVPGGGDLRAVPEESLLWNSLSTYHDRPGYHDDRISVSEFSRKELSRWPWNFMGDESRTYHAEALSTLGELCAEPIGAQFITGKDDAFVLPRHLLRRFNIAPANVRAYATGEDVRNWSVRSSEFIIFPYDSSLRPLTEPLPKGILRHLGSYRSVLENSIISGSTKKKETKLKWFEFRRLARAKFATPNNIINPHIATHQHFTVANHEIVFKEKALAIALAPRFGLMHCDLLAGWLNSSLMCDWLKSECFNKGAGDEEQRDRYEYAGEKLRSIPIPSWIDRATRGSLTGTAAQVAALATKCRELGHQIVCLALSFAFAKEGEAYQSWDAQLIGHPVSALTFEAPFSTSEELKARVIDVHIARDHLRDQMISLQEEMDWFVYHAYDLVPAAQVVVDDLSDKGSGFASIPSLLETQRPFRIWAAAEGRFDAACKLIPTGDQWTAERRMLWRARLECIRDNGKIRRMEQPVYKRRWDEQWKVANRWMAGPIAYAQELVDAFSEWLADKSEWHLEHKVRGGPIHLSIWTDALWSDPRVNASWPVVAEALNSVELFRTERRDVPFQKIKIADKSRAAFDKFTKKLINDEAVPAGIPHSISYDELERKGFAVPKRVRDVRGKLNVPRERFHQLDDKTFIWAGKH